MRGDLLVAADQGDVGDEQADQSFAFADRGRRVAPERGEVGGERADPGLLLVGERPVAGLRWRARTRLWRRRARAAWCSSRLRAGRRRAGWSGSTAR